jgi:hypothetical protein
MVPALCIHRKHATSVGDRLGVSRVSAAEMRSPICCVLEDNVLLQLQNIIQICLWSPSGCSVCYSYLVGCCVDVLPQFLFSPLVSLNKHIRKYVDS